MNLHEYQAKQLFAEYGLPVSTGYAVDTPQDAADAAQENRRESMGRQGPGARRRSRQGRRRQTGRHARRKSKRSRKSGSGKRLVTIQTDAHGQPVSKIYVESCTDIERELYLGAVIDRATRRVVFMASTEGGVEIEKVAEETPEKIIRATIDPFVGAQPFQGP